MKLHLGCGERDIKDWINVDLSNYSHVHYRSPVENLSMFEDETAEIIYSSHTLEYFDRQQVKEVLLEWRRVLKTGGILRLAVPDFQSLIKVYEQTGEIDKILGPLYGKMVIPISDEKCDTIYHKTAYDYPSLKKLLLSTGFKSIRRYNWRNTEHSSYDDHSQAYYPHMEKEKGLLVSLNVEAIKC